MLTMFIVTLANVVIYKPFEWTYRYKCEQTYGNQSPPDYAFMFLKGSMRGWGVAILINWIVTALRIAEARFSTSGQVCSGYYLHKKSEDEYSEE